MSHLEVPNGYTSSTVLLRLGAGSELIANKDSEMDNAQKAIPAKMIAGIAGVELLASKNSSDYIAPAPGTTATGETC